jgi:hypothetical protein
MAAIMDWFGSGNSAPTLADMIGPQTDGTNIIANTAVAVTPADTAGGLPADYSQSVLDLFKFGVGTWAESNKTQQLFDYKKFEATQAGLIQQGRTAGMYPMTTAAGKNGGGMVWLIGGAVLLAVLLTRKG